MDDEENKSNGQEKHEQADQTEDEYEDGLNSESD